METQSQNGTKPPRIPPGKDSLAAAHTRLTSQPCDIDTFDEMSQAIRAAGAALRGADNVKDTYDAALLVDFAREAIEKGESALNAHIAGRA